ADGPGEPPEHPPPPPHRPERQQQQRPRDNPQRRRRAGQAKNVADKPDRHRDDDCKGHDKGQKPKRNPAHEAAPRRPTPPAVATRPGRPAHRRPRLVLRPPRWATARTRWL